ncbi:SpoIIE family protein phosphatase [Streptomyces sp. NPDC048664]|uniref:SpoIIE family protein phosphatase n=1 Tax=Streptomyces sp. NPDC048664 TaxID=3154505 RepID=UPI0034426C7A
MTSSNPVGERRRGGTATPVQGMDLAAVLHRGVRRAMQRLGAIAAAVYLLSEDGSHLRVAMIAGTPPSLFTMPGVIELDAPYATARALAGGTTAVLADPDPEGPGPKHAAYPYVALSAPVVSGDHRYGAVTVVRPATDAGYRGADRAGLREVGEELAAAFVDLEAHGVAVAPGPVPVLVPAEPDEEHTVRTPGWGVSGVPGSAGLSLMYPLTRLVDLLNRARTMADVVEAAQYCLMHPFGADALVLASAAEGRLWVVGHGGASAAMVRCLHGARLDARAPAAEAVRGHPLFLPEREPSAPGCGGPEGAVRAEAYLPLTGSRVSGLPLIRTRNVVGVCCLSFQGPRDFPPEERAVLSMMAASLGAAVERVELSSRRHEVAEYLQRWLLPATLCELPGLTTTARYRPATATSKVGGDWYDVLRLPGERMVLVVGDVEGHALKSAAVMGQVRTAVAAYASEGHRPAAVIDRTGRLLAELGSDLLVTCCVVALDTTDGIAEVALAGHPEPLVLRPDGTVGDLAAPANVPLGVAVPEPCLGREHTVEPGAVLMLYSNGLVDDGVLDPGRGARALLGSAHHEAHHDLEPLADRIIAAAARSDRRRDDAVLLLARYEGAGGEGAPRTAGLHIQRRDLHGVKAARGFVADRLRSWGLPEVADDLQLAVSEIVTNALVHAGSDVDVRLRAFPDRLRLEVRDSDSNPPVPSPLSVSEEGSAEAEHGRGMCIVQALAGQWNSSPNGRGKTVSLDMPLPVPPAAVP